MGRTSHSGGVRRAGKHSIELTFRLNNRRCRPTIPLLPNKRNLRRARKQLEQVKEQIANHTFVLHETFPNYRGRLRAVSEQLHATLKPTCNEMFDRFLAHCQMRVDLKDMAHSTMLSYRRILDFVWRPHIGSLAIDEVRYTRLVTIAETHARKKKTYNNIVSVARCAFDFMFGDYPEDHNPAKNLKTLRVTKKDRPPIEPFTIQEGEQIIARSHREFGPAHGNYEEWRFFTGARQSEAMALQVGDLDLEHGRVRISKACVYGRLEDRTKTKEDREIPLCRRALQVLRRQLAMREILSRAGRIRHAFVFFEADGSPLRNLSYTYDRWRYVLMALGIPYRAPKNARHSWVSWSLMANRGPLRLATEDGHSVETMYRVYAAWTKGATDVDVRMIKRAMNRSPKPHYPIALADVLAPGRPPVTLPSMSGLHTWGRLSWRKFKKAHRLH